MRGPTRYVRAARRGTLAVGRVSGLVLTLLSATCLAAGEAPAGGDVQQKGFALIARAELLQSLVAADTGPFRLTARVTLFGLVSGTRGGEYSLVAAGPGQWLEQVHFPGYSESSGLYEGVRWRKRNVIDKPYRFHEVTQLFDLARHLRLPPNAEIKAFRERDVGGTKAFCITASPTRDLWQKEMAGSAAFNPVGFSRDSEVTLCFGTESGLLLGAAYQGEMPRFEYEGQVTLGNKVFPKILRCFEGGELVVEATVEGLARDQVQDTAAFAPAEGAERWPACSDLQPPQLIGKRGLTERRLAFSRARRQYGTVYCLAEIGTDGTVHDFTWVQSRYGSIAGAARDAVSAWRYTPSTCNGVPVPVTIYIAYTFPP